MYYLIGISAFLAKNVCSQQTEKNGVCFKLDSGILVVDDCSTTSTITSSTTSSITPSTTSSITPSITSSITSSIISSTTPSSTQDDKNIKPDDNQVSNVNNGNYKNNLAALSIFAIVLL